MPTSKLINKNIYSHIIFWVLLYLFFVVPTLGYEENKLVYMLAYGTKLGPQMIMAYGMIYLLIPHVLKKRGKILFGISAFTLLYVVFVIYTTLRYYWFELTFPEYYRVPRDFSYWWRITDFRYFAKNIIWFLFPAVILMAVQYYRHQKEALALREQKKTAELDALKNQLNPHFLFNTLNNLYALALKKSDQTPEVIAKLSEILDYILYRCNDNFVTLKNEITLLKNYIDLEKVRYGKRVIVEFEHDIQEDVKIAPLLLLTFLENAFKHGVSQEINVAKIKIELSGDNNGILFQIENTSSLHKANSHNKDRDAIGLQNINKQLDLLYPNNYTLVIEENKENYKVTLKLNAK